jgi:predicted lipid-binding transport protein (Tim44 family)
MMRIRSALVAAVLSAGMVAGSVAIDEAEARRGGGFGSRGARTWAAPPVTQTAPRPAQPIERSATPRPAPGATAGAPATAPRPGLFGSGFGGTLMRGLLIGGLIGMLFGGGLGGLAGMLGLIVQLGLLALGIMLLMRFLARRREGAPATAGASPRPGGGLPFGLSSQGSETIGSRSGGPVNRGAGPMGALAGLGPSGSRPADALNNNDFVGIGQRDLDAFERMLVETQAAYAREDTNALSRLATPEVASQFADELRDQAAQGLRNDVSDVRLLQGDLAEAWREDGRDYATVAMRYASRDLMRDRGTGEVVSGDPEAPTETTEVWTFTRPAGGQWQLAAIQDA